MTVASWLEAFCGGRGLGGLTNGRGPANLWQAWPMAPCKPSKPPCQASHSNLCLIRNLGTTTSTTSHNSVSSLNFLQRYWIISASHCVKPQNDSPHLQRWEPLPASPRRIKSCNGTVRHGKCPSSPRRALAHRGTTRTRLDDHNHIHIYG
jgi:hypothetical protein